MKIEELSAFQKPTTPSYHEIPFYKSSGKPLQYDQHLELYRLDLTPFENNHGRMDKIIARRDHDLLATKPILQAATQINQTLPLPMPPLHGAVPHTSSRTGFQPGYASQEPSPSHTPRVDGCYRGGAEYSNGNERDNLHYRGTGGYLCGGPCFRRGVEANKEHVGGDDPNTVGDGTTCEGARESRGIPCNDGGNGGRGRIIKANCTDTKKRYRAGRALLLATPIGHDLGYVMPTHLCLTQHAHAVFATVSLADRLRLLAIVAKDFPKLCTSIASTSGCNVLYQLGTSQQ